MDHFLDAAFKKAQDEGQLDNLPGAGKPISPSSLTADPFAHVYKESGIMHPMAELREEIAQLNTALKAEADQDRRRDLQIRISGLQTRLAVESETWARFT